MLLLTLQIIFLTMVLLIGIGYLVLVARREHECHANGGVWSDFVVTVVTEAQNKDGAGLMYQRVSFTCV
jgi:hypothetical protein